MPRNEGNLDRVLRGVAGFAFVAFALMAQIANPIFYWGALIVGAVMLVTAATGFCPAYRLFGLKTCRDC